MSSDAQSELPTARSPRTQSGPHAIAVCAAAFTLPLLFVGGSVTTYRVGLAVPDWPSTFGINMFLYDFWNAPFGVRVEHTHRLYGAAVGLATAILAGWFLAFESRRWLKAMGVLALAAVISQGVLGGTRVTQVSTFLAAVHGCMGQAVFGLMVALCVWTGRDWQAGGELLPDREQLRRRSLVILGLVASQIVLGSWLRHYGSTVALVLHSVFALAVWGHALVFFVRLRRQHAARNPLNPSAWTLAVTTSFQILLGIVSLIYLYPFDGTPRPVSFYQAVARTSHQTNGALVLASAVVLCLRAFRHLSLPEDAGRSRWDAAGWGQNPKRKQPDLEAVA
jgi:cytochrome c oxidase assembly protein subunit 15